MKRARRNTTAPNRNSILEPEGRDVDMKKKSDDDDDGDDDDDDVVDDSWRNSIEYLFLLLLL